jgi:UDP-3-O-[3-hydroxymyristoyl] N-acetylglucosamine deacetylase
MLYQRTLRVPVHAIGIGVHSGRKTRMRLAPAPAGTGVHFVRADLPNAPSIPALAAYVCDTQLSTSIGADDVRVVAIEHLLSALHGLGIDNLRIELNGEEVPILDGSAAPFVDLIQGAGIVQQAMPRQFIRIKKKISVCRGEARASLRPYAGFKAAYTFESDHPVFNRYPKSAEVDLGCHSYQEAVGPARSFGRVDELDQARQLDRCLGSSLDNAVGVGDVSILNPEGLRSEDEFVKHKLLDAIGDLYLLGRPVLGAFEGHQSGHALNVELVRALLARQDAWHLITAAPERIDVAERPVPMAAALEA